jgi:DNA-binding MarR family transcriptional regulator
MNENIINNDELLQYQTRRLKELINEMLKCCDERKLREVKRFALPHAELKCLMLFGTERYLTVKSLTQKMKVAKSRITKIVNGLMQKELVKQMNDPQDTRVKLISLTPAGQKSSREIDSFQGEIFRRMLLHIEPDDRNRTLAALETLHTAMEAVKEQTA